MYQEKVTELLANQFCDSVEFIKLLKQLMLSYDNANDILQYLYNNLDIDVAVGAWLDLIGVIVGQPRAIDNAVAIQFFGYSQNPVNGGYDQARYWNGKESLFATSVLADPEYRIAIKARINNNYADSSKPGVAESMRILTDDNENYVYNLGDAKVLIYFGQNLTLTQRNLINALDLLPVAAGIGIKKYYGEPAEIFSYTQSITPAGYGVGRYVGEF